MCEHHHAAKHILCPQCDMLVALPASRMGKSSMSTMRRNVNDRVGRAPAASYRLCVSGTIYVAAF